MTELNIDQKRNNYYDQSVYPKDKHDGFFWPTDEEFDLILSVILSKRYTAHRYALHGESGFNQELKHFENEDRYAWLCLHLQESAMGYTVPLTSSMILESLKSFERMIVTPWLVSNARF